jgi:putative transposase
MCNEAIKIAVNEKPKNRFNLIELAYIRLKEYGLHTNYILTACEVAFSLYKNKRRKSIPNVQRAFLKLDNQAYQISHLLLRIPIVPRRFIFLTLQGSAYDLSFVDNPALKRGSVTITEEKVVIAFSKKTEVMKPQGLVGIDINLDNVTVSGTNDYFKRFNELREVDEIKERYRQIRARISRVTRGDRRIGKRLLTKYGEREKNRTTQRIHKVTKQIVEFAKEHKLGIKLEKLKGIRKLYRKGNGQGNLFRGRMNSWVFGETQRQIDYKAKWDGVPLWYVNPLGTSSYCLCGSRVVSLAFRKLYCPTCDRTWDRDDLASKNIMACAVQQVRPSKGSNEGESADYGNPSSRCREGLLGV